MDRINTQVQWLVTQIPWLENPLRIILFFLLALIIHRFNDQLAYPLAKLTGITQKKGPFRRERQNTLREVIASGII